MDAWPRAVRRRVAEELNHYPDLDLRYDHLNVRLMSHDVWAKTARDVQLARRISELAASMGVTAVPSAVSRLEIGLDTWDVDEIKMKPRFVVLADPQGNKICICTQIGRSD